MFLLMLNFETGYVAKFKNMYLEFSFYAAFPESERIELKFLSIVKQSQKQMHTKISQFTEVFGVYSSIY